MRKIIGDKKRQTKNRRLKISEFGTEAWNSVWLLLGGKKTMWVYNMNNTIYIWLQTNETL